MFDRALGWFASVYGSEATAPHGWLTGVAAVRAHVADLRAGTVTPSQAGHLTGFVYKLGARRALDYAAFFGERRPDLAELKRRQAALFGRAHTLAVREDWSSVAAVAEQIAEIEERLTDALK